MANLAHAKKQARKSVRQRGVNLARKTAVKSALKKVEEALLAKDAENAEKFLREAEAKLARAASKGLIHKNNASRNVSRLAIRLAKIASPKKQAPAKAKAAK
jgi:small subunit ribosomal protein S20